MLEKFLDKFTQNLLLLVLIVVAIGYFRPQAILVFKNYTEWFFSLTMLGIGAVLDIEDFKPIIKKPKYVLLGTLAQFAIMPALGFFIARILRVSGDFGLGIILVGSVPGAMASNLICYLAKIDVAYSIALTTCSTLLSPLLTPFFTYIFGSVFLKIDFLPMFFSIIKMVILPLFLGFFIRRKFTDKIEKISKIFPAISCLFIAFICGLVVALNREVLSKVSGVIFLAVFLHNLGGLLLGFLAGKFYGFELRRCRTLAIEVGMQNAGLGAVLALKHFSPTTAVPNAFFAVWCIITASFLAALWSRGRFLMQ